MAFVGQACLVMTLAVTIATAGMLLIGQRGLSKGSKTAESAVNLGYLAIFVTALLLTVSILIIAVGFFTADFRLEYVAKNYPNNHSIMQWLYLLAGVWGGREGSLLFWAWLIGVFNAWAAYQRHKETDAISNVALAIANLVLAMFLGTLIFSSSNNPFKATDPSLIGPNGELVGIAVTWGMNKLLEHWAMVLHPPALFVGYAGMTLPFAYAMGSLIVGDVSNRWIGLVNRITLFAWTFLTIGIGLGAVWAYVVLGWGGYWGWDAVENASLLSWLTSTALLHSMTVYRKRNHFKMWSVVLASVTFIFVILGTFITRSGIVQSVHAFSNDTVSTVMFLAMMIIAFVAMLLGLAARRKGLSDEDDIESLFSKNGTYYLTNVILLASGVIVAYLTVAPALPPIFPLGGSVVGAGAFNLIARPVGVLFLALAAVCPLLSWAKTDKAQFFKNIKVPALLALALFAVLLAFFWVELLPIYRSDIQGGGDVAQALQEQGPALYYHGLAIAGFFVGSLLFMNSLYLLVRGVRARKANKRESTFEATKNLFAKSPAQAGGYLAHLSMAILLIGLVGSAMYVQEHTYELDTKPGAVLQMGKYELVYNDSVRERLSNGDARFGARFTVKYKGADKGQIEPDLVIPQGMQGRGQQFLHASVITLPTQDLFVAFQGYSASGKLVVTVKINPLILCVWTGLILLIVSGALAGLPKRHIPRVRSA